MMRTTAAFGVLLCLVGAAFAAFPSDMPKSFGINATVQGLYNYDEYNYYRFGAGLSTSNFNAFIQNPSTNPNALISIGVTLPGEFYAGASYLGNALVKVENPTGVGHFFNTSMRAAVWDDWQCGMGYYQYMNSAENGFNFPYYIDWMFWNIWTDQGVFLGNETVHGVKCFVYEVAGSQPMSFMMIWINTEKPEPVQWTLSYRSSNSYDTAGFTVNVVADKFTQGSSSSPDVPERCEISMVRPTSFLARKMDEQLEFMRKSSNAAKETSKNVRKMNFAKHAAERKLEHPVIDLHAMLADGHLFFKDLHRQFSA